MAFIDDFIKLLREASYPDLLSKDKGRRLADDLEWRRKKPRGDGFDIDVTGDDEKDREILAAWVEAGAHAPAFLSPPCGRNFSEDTAVLLRHSLDGPFLDYDKAHKIRVEEHFKKLDERRKARL